MSANSPGGSVPPTQAGSEAEGPSSPSGARFLAGTPVDLEWKGTSRYQVVRRLGQGGMGVVYEAIDRERSQRVALKTLIHFSPAALYRFKQEFRTLAGVQHPNLVRLYELVVTETDGVFFAMELVQGTDFLTYVQKPGVASVGHADSRVTGVALTRRDLPTESLVNLEGSDTVVGPELTTSPSDFDKLRPALRQLVEGVQALHGAGKLHRDIKPSNVLMAPDGRVVILDFGVATEFSRVTDANLSEEHEMVGTVRYMAPEQAFDGVPTPASDWYSVGVVLYEALVGQPPFSGGTIDVLSMKTLSDPLPPGERVGGVPADLDELCRALLEREPEKRPTGFEILRRLGVTRSVRPLASPLPAADPAKATTLVGREAQLQALRDAFETVRSGRPVTVRVGGLSGMGKTAVVQHFLDGLVEGGEAVVLRGRAYERESLPYKAVDSVIDALSRYLMHLDEQGDAVELPSDVGALARVFPVLRRVPSIGEAAEEAVTDPQLVRRSAFGALRELLGSLAKRQPLVLYVDDAQWGDTDSAALLLDLTRPPDAPPVLLVMTYREDDAKTSPFLTEMRIRWPSGAESRDIAVGPLAAADAQRLALALLDAPAEVAQRTARAVARESRGNPFLIEELVRSNRGIAARSDGQTLAVLTLDQMVSQRLERLPDDARLLLEIVAVGGRPLPVSVVAQASGVGDAIDDVIALVSARRFVRGSLRDGKELVETSHDRFRETIVAQLSSETLRERHARLAHALEAAPGVDAEAVAMHLLGAGQGERAAVYAEQAAEQAATKLAFDQAARLFRVTLDAIAPSSPDARRLHERLGKVLEWAGRAAEAAEAYQQAAEGAPPLERAEL
jgi:serine/threonine protein kinase